MAIGANNQKPPRLHWWVVLIAVCCIISGSAGVYQTWTAGSYAIPHADGYSASIVSGPGITNPSLLLLATAFSGAFIMCGIGLLWRKLWAWGMGLVIVGVLALALTFTPALPFALFLWGLCYLLWKDKAVFTNIQK